MFTGYLAKAADMFPGEVNGDNGKMMRDRGAIGKLRYTEVDRLEMGKKIEELETIWE